jgi:hypothetical protein
MAKRKTSEVNNGSDSSFASLKDKVKASDAKRKVAVKPEKIETPKSVLGAKRG